MTQIQTWVAQKQTWVCQHIAAEQQRLALQRKQRYQSGALLFYLGDAKSLKLQVANACDIQCYAATILLQAPQDALLADQSYLKRRLHAWYRQQTLDVVTRLCDHWGMVMGFQPRSVKVRRYRARWGCCRANGEITFHDLLSMAPEPVIEYVVIHELAHLKHMNHSADFWQWVAQHQPDYKTHVAWLHDHQYRIAL